jgi:HSP20 family molecular chaperone IbpA
MATTVQKREHRSPLADLFDWIEEGIAPLPTWSGMPVRGGIRIEDRLTEDSYVLRAELPGIDPEKDVEITVADGALTIKAERQEEHKEAGRSEFRYGAFARRVVLPAGAKEDDVTAKYTDGILEVTVGLAKEAAQPKQIPVTREK